MTPPDWVQAMRERCAAASVPIEWSNPLFASPLADVPTLLALAVTLAEALDTIEYWDRADVANSSEDVRRRMGKHAREALAMYQQGPRATTGGGT